MARGRKALPAEIKALKGNPGKRALVLGDGKQEAGPVKAPSYVSTAMEKQIFARVSQQLASVRFIKATDADTLGRWTVYMAKWVDIKQRLKKEKADVYYETESKHGKMLRAHPLYAALLQIEKILMALDDRIGLNPSSRQAILRGIINAPNIPSDNLFDQSNQAQEAAPEPSAVAAEMGPLGFLASKH